MTAYVDTSVLLRLVLREAGALDELRSYDSLVSSELIALESCRTIDKPIIVTHDAALGLAARTFGFEVRGI